MTNALVTAVRNFVRLYENVSDMVSPEIRAQVEAARAALADADSRVHPIHEGMSLRDYFAAGVAAVASRDITDALDVAVRAYAIADAMLKERSK